MYPRWASKGTFTPLNRTAEEYEKSDFKIAQSYVFMGNSTLERNLDIANGYPDYALKAGEIIIDGTVSDLFNGLRVGDSLKYTLDLMDFVTEDQSKELQEHILNKADPTEKAELIGNLFNIDLTKNVSDFLAPFRLEETAYLPSEVLASPIKTPLISILKVFDSTSDLTYDKVFKIKAIPSMPRGKWTRTIANGGFCEAHYFFRDFANEMIEKYFDQIFADIELSFLSEIQLRAIKINAYLDVGTYNYNQFAMQTMIMFNERLGRYKTDNAAPLLKVFNKLTLSNLELF